MEKKRPTIGYLMFDLDGGYQHAIWQGVDDTIKEHNVNLICFVGGHLDAPESTQRNIVYDLANPTQLDGLIVMSSTLGGRVTQERLQEFLTRYKGIPIVSIGLSLPGMHNILVDNRAGLHQAITHLVEDHGNRRIAFVRGPVGYDEADQRYQVYLDVLAEHDIPFDPDLVLPGAFQPEDGAAAVRTLMDERQVAFDAIVGANDFMVVGALGELQRRGVKMPEEVALVGFDDIVDARSVMPPLTTVRQPLHKQGRHAAEIILALLDGETIEENLFLPTEMVTRQSCGCFSEMTLHATVEHTPQQAAVKDDAAVMTAVSTQRDTIITALQGSHSPNLFDDEANWAAQLYESFLADLSDTSETRSAKGAFLSALERMLNESSIMGDSIIEWQDVISSFRQQLLPYLGSTALLIRAENIWNQSRVLIGEIAERVQYSFRHEAGTQARRVNDIGSKLITTFDLDDLTDILAKELPSLNIRSCYVALYEDPANPTDKARLIMGYDENGRIQLDPDKSVFPTKQLILDGTFPSERTYSMMVQPLYFQQDQLGYVLFEITNRDGLVYETLKGQISSSLKGALLVQQEERRAQQLQTVAEVSTITSTILDPTELLQKMTDLVKERFNLYHAQVYLLNEAKDTLKLVAGAGEIGAQMIAEGWHIPMVRERSLITRAVQTRNVVLVDNVQQSASWMANEKLPHTQAEIVVPIILQQEVVGVLDVQSDQVAGLDENDANLLRSLASQVAVNLNNARLFAETVLAKEAAEKAQAAAEQLRAEAEQAKAEAEAAQKVMGVQVWQTTGQTELSQQMSGEQDMPTLANNVIRQLCSYLHAQIGALYMVNNNTLHLLGSYAFSSKHGNIFSIGEGLVGQAALDKKPLLIKDIPEDYITIRSGFGEMVPRHIMAVPFIYEDNVLGVIELGTIAEFTQQQLDFLETAVASISIAFNTALARAQIDDLLVQTQKQAEELQAQGEELRVANEELEAQTESLRLSEAKLKEKQIELETTNTQLEEKAAALEESSSALREKQAALDVQNRELKEAQTELERKAEELALASKYKSEFLANMSHELRTPLNSLLILARMLMENQEGNLTGEQVESAQIIYSGGNDLLTLINDILDLSKVESGKMTFTIEPMPLTDILRSVEAQFAHVAAEKGLEFNLSLDDDLPATIETDQQRILQVVKNMLSNAFKFTAQGSVSLDIYKPEPAAKLSRPDLNPATTVAISVVDTGIGMTPEQKKIIFEAFQQADGSTSRQYGGTGLGLSISRELAAALGGVIEVSSEEGKGSTFTLYLPLSAGAAGEKEVKREKVTVTAVATPTTKATPAPKQKAKPTNGSTHTLPPAPAIADDRNKLHPGDKTLLLIEDDTNFAKIVYDFAHKNGFKCLMATDGHTGMSLVDKYKPSAIILDLNLPDMSGWDILEQIKNNPETRHIPIHIASVDEEVLEAYRKGAMGYLTKPVSKEVLEESFVEIEDFISKKIKSLLLVEDDENSRRSIQKLLGGNDVQITEADLGQKALDLLKKQQFDCIILDLTLPDMTGFEVLSRMNGVAYKCPIIVYTGRDLTPEENDELMKYADSVIVKGVKSPERLIDETALFLHRVVADMPEEKQNTIKQLHNKDAALKDKRILIVDDDMRNSFALSKLLSEKGIVVKIAQNGQKALDLLAVEPIDLVLMDIMMPVMDGYETTRQIRKNPSFNGLPILALTAKAMKGDREKCIEAGANDYLPKPIDVDRLFSMLRVWLYQ